MNKKISFLLVILFYFAGASMPVSAANLAVEMEPASDKPLMVIRFNQPHVSYEQPLYNTVSRALQVKPSAVFDVVSVAPKGKNEQAQMHNNVMASQNTKRVLATLADMGLPKSRINLVKLIDQVDSSEVRIIVR
jgi:hypothetical protein